MRGSSVSASRGVLQNTSVNPENNSQGNNEPQRQGSKQKSRPKVEVPKVDLRGFPGVGSYRKEDNYRTSKRSKSNQGGKSLSANRGPLGLNLGASLPGRVTNDS